MFKKNISILRLGFILVILSICYPTYGQNRKYYEKIKNEKKQSLAYSKKLIGKLKYSHEDNINRLLITREQISKEKEILNILSKELILLEEEILIDERNAQRLTEELNILQEEYRNLILFSWVNFGIQKRMIFIFSAENFNKAYKRAIYLKYLADFRKTRSGLLKEKRIKIDSSIYLLKTKRDSKEMLKREKSVHIDSLEIKRKELNLLVNSYRNEIEKLNKIVEKENQQKDITNRRLESQIIIVEENKSITNSKKIDKLDHNLGSKFEINKKKHIWPLAKYVILHRFGDYSHPGMDNIMVKNDGIELGAGGFSNVHCIFDGSVVSIIEIPGAGNSIIIKHGEYYSVYNKTDKVLIKPGDIVQKGQVIAKLGGGDKMVKMNFQLWRGKSKLNPELWLK